ncbi:MAG: N-acetyl-gamma-glutamyl-phosphate reductase, partial [Pirellulaceae bacterium]
DPVLYSNWYKVEHPDPERLPNVPYGLPEFFKEQIKDAPVVANPGCFPTGAVLALAPLLVDKIIEPDSIIIDSKSGVSGAGRNPKLGTHYPECNESIAAYSVGQHRHMPEIDFVLGKVTGKNVETIFTPHLVPMDRGILTTAYANPTSMVNENDLIDLYREFYRDAPFVRVVDHLPATKDTMNTNYCDVTLRVVRGRIIVISSIDNLVKGASGAAVQNMNVMYGFEETTALI